MKKSEFEKMISGELYSTLRGDFKDVLDRRNTFLDEFNDTKIGDFETRRRLINVYFEKVGKNAVINKPFYCDYGCNISVGDNFYANFDCIFLDVSKITIGNNVMLAPRVGLYTAGHPIDANVRNDMLELGKPITIGDDVWIGANVIVLPGVTIGSNVVIGAGSVVNKDIPSNVIAVGNPCKVKRMITESDKTYWEELARKYYESE